MKLRIISLIMVVLSVGCIGPNHNAHPTRIGPDRFVISSTGHDVYSADNYVYLLQRAYETCVSAGYQDYVVYNTARDEHKAIIYVRCGTNPQPEDGNSTLSDLERWYEETKKKIAERLNK